MTAAAPSSDGGGGGAAVPGCVSADELVALLEGALPADQADALDAHVDGCPSCAAVVAELGALADGTPRRVGRYLLERTLGVGGMGVVWAAWDPELERRVAVKLVRPRGAGGAGGAEGTPASGSSSPAPVDAATDAVARARMVREARALARINHPNVVAVHDVGEHDGRVFVATELVDGETMARWQLGRGWREVVGAWIQAARGLAAAHAEGLVHRDVKPANVFVGRDGRVRVGDFGLARADTAADAETAPEAGRAVARPAPAPRAAGVAAPLTAAGHVAGTPGYMAPEQRKGPVDARADQFALCVAVVEALTGRRPEADARPAIRDVPVALVDVLARGLAADPAARFPTTAALADALAGALGATAPAAAVVAPPAERGRGAGAIAAVAVVIAALGVAGGVLVFARGGDEAPPLALDLEPIVEPAPAPTPAPDPVVTPVPEAPAGPPAVAPVATPRPKTPPRTPAPTPAQTPAQTPAPNSTPSLFLHVQFLDKAGQDAAAARTDEDAAACLRALGAADPAEPPERLVTRATCEMMAGRCAAGSARIRAAFPPGQATDYSVDWIERLYCPSTEGDLTTRVRRFQVQAVDGPRLAFALDRYLAQLHALADDPDLASVKAGRMPVSDDGPTVVGKAFLRFVPHLRTLGRCDDVARLLAKATARGVNVPDDPFQRCP